MRKKRADSEPSPATPDASADGQAGSDQGGAQEAADRAGHNGQGGQAGAADSAENAENAQAEGRVAELEAGLAEAHERHLRAEAELQNVIKRHSRELSERARYAAEGLARDLLDVIDDLDRALEHAGEPVEGGKAQEMAGVVEGVKMVRAGLLAALERHGIKRLESLGQPFDPSEHDAVALVDSSEHGANTVVDEHRAGYRIHDRLLRPAMVAVSKTPAQNCEDGQDPEDK